MRALAAVILAVLAAVAGLVPWGVTSARKIFVGMSHPSPTGCALAGHIMTAIDTPQARARGPPSPPVVDLRPAVPHPRAHPPTADTPPGNDPVESGDAARTHTPTLRDEPARTPMTDIPDLPIVPLPGYEGWADAYEWGGALDKQFPGQDADEFAYACGYNDTGPAQNREITDFVMAQRGENDGADWIWHVTFADATRWIAQGGCDYTGWDCMSDLTWTLAND